MTDVEILRKVLNPSIQISKLCLSYVTRLFPEYKESPCIILYKEEHYTECTNNHLEYINNDQTSKFDITGSPLKCSFEEVDFEDSIILVKQSWYKEEEKYLPLSRTEACDTLNACIDFLKVDFPPIFALCNGNDNKKTRLLGTTIQKDWFTTIEICSVDIETLETIKESSTSILQEHLKLSHAKGHNVTISAFNTFDLYGISEELINWDENVKSNFVGSLVVEVDSSTLSLYPPTRASKNNLVAQIVSGSSNSPLKELWTQLLLLNQYLNIVEEYKKQISSSYTPSPLEFPKDFTSSYKEEHTEIMKNINLLLNGDYSYRPDTVDTDKINFINEENLENTVQIKQCIQALPFRYNLDFTDFLWELLIKNSNYFDMTKCIHTVLEEIIMNECFAQVNLTNSTRFAKVITNPSQHRIISPLLSGSLPLEYVIDMGFEKLYRDYTYILISSRFSDKHNIQEKLGNISCGEFVVDVYRERLQRLSQIHMCLEFMLLLQDNLECSTDDLRSLYLCAFQQYVSEKSPIQNSDLNENIIYTLRAPLPVSAINILNKEILTTRRISLSSESKLSKLTTIKYYNRIPIFPRSIYPLGKIFFRNMMYDTYNSSMST
ncbi:Protein zwilch like protein [Dufourea novaeangliae]|uniref:Protein zwilch n=1 Tax=Dufourea novaeangliae TaxID=178035 RepID=A0A154PQE7_DUFNO|nr:Protein zwilch like protein [Dufourea novaeangliae]